MIFGIPIMLLILLNYYLFCFRIFIYFTFNISLVAITGEVFHSSYHLFNNAETHPRVPIYVHRFITRLPFYNYLRDMHDIHHAKKDTNFDLLIFKWINYLNILKYYTTIFKSFRIILNKIIIYFFIMIMKGGGY